MELLEGFPATSSSDAATGPSKLVSVGMEKDVAVNVLSEVIAGRLRSLS